jgi:hypothetical protein
MFILYDFTVYINVCALAIAYFPAVYKIPESMQWSSINGSVCVQCILHTFQKLRMILYVKRRNFGKYAMGFWRGIAHYKNGIIILIKN